MTSNINPDKLMKLAEAATEGPWKLVERADYREVLAPDPECTWYGEPNAHAVLYCDTEIDETEQDANAGLIVYLRNNVPTILSQADEIARLRKALEYCAEAPGSGWTIAQAMARAALSPPHADREDGHDEG